ncbi:hypothetical protein [Salibacter halophilus]|uniref:Uncharacterized protein n=1 Tax=Salibacter halophilus TaxID=1803916 RepID=A0A6N6MBH0_9FLAO|nr:hypothetical protein [Salibacter halophilus]KAB1065897.1 hypothetical protein F3059_00040 [Salibacter halophilus]
MKRILSLLMLTGTFIMLTNCSNDPATRGEWFDYIRESDYLSKTITGSKLKYDFILIPNDFLNLIEGKSKDRKYSTVYLDISIQEEFENEKERIFKYLNWAFEEHGNGNLKVENSTGLRIDNELLIKEKRPIQSNKIRLIGTFNRLKKGEEYSFIFSHEGIPEYQLHFKNLSYK